jgi:hypothetical protein
MSNIKNDKAYDPFPKTGKVKEYEPFIRDWVAKFCEQYPLVHRDHALIEAVKLAIEFESSKWDSSRGYDFSTPLRWHLKGLKRILVDREKTHSRRLIHAKDAEVSEGLAQKVMLDDAALAEHDRRAIEEKLEALPVTFGAGANGTRITLDLNGMAVGSQINSKVPAAKLAKRFDYARETLDGLSADLRKLIGVDLGDGRPALIGRMRAVIAHNDRRQREAEQEAENQRNGDYGPVFLEPRDTLRPDVQFRPPKTRATPKPNVPKPPRISEKPDLGRLDQVLCDLPQEDRLALLLGAGEDLRPSLDTRDCVILDWLFRPRGRTLTALAGEIDITKGYASKLQGKILDRLRKKMTVAPEEQRKLIGRGRHIWAEQEAAARAELIRRGWVQD